MMSKKDRKASRRNSSLFSYTDLSSRRQLALDRYFTSVNGLNTISSATQLRLTSEDHCETCPDIEDSCAERQWLWEKAA